MPRSYRVPTPAEAQARIEQIIRAYETGQAKLMRSGVNKVAARAIYWDKQSVSGNVAGRDPHVITGRHRDSLNWQERGSLNDPQAAIGAYMAYSEKVTKLDDPPGLEFGAQMALFELDDIIGDEDIDRHMWG